MLLWKGSQRREAAETLAHQQCCQNPARAGVVYSLPPCSGDRAYHFHSSHFAEATLCCATHCLVLPLRVSSSCSLQTPSPGVLTSHPPVHRQRLMIRFIYSVSEYRELQALYQIVMLHLFHTSIHFPPLSTTVHNRFLPSGRQGP